MNELQLITAVSSIFWYYLATISSPALLPLSLFIFIASLFGFLGETVNRMALRSIKIKQQKDNK